MPTPETGLKQVERPETGEHRPVLEVEADFGWADAAVHAAAPVRVGESVGQLDRARHGLVELRRAVLAVAGESLGERGSAHERRDDEVRDLVGLGEEHPENVAVIQFGDAAHVLSYAGESCDSSVLSTLTITVRSIRRSSARKQRANSPTPTGSRSS